MAGPAPGPNPALFTEARRLLGVIDRRLAQRAWIMGDGYTIADIAIFPWINVLNTFCEAGDLVGVADFSHVTRALSAFLVRPAVVRGLEIPKRPTAA